MNIFKKGLNFISDFLGFGEEKVDDAGLSSRDKISNSTPSILQSRDQENKALVFPVGEGLKNVTEVLPGPRKTTLAAIQRGEEIKTVPVGAPIKPPVPTQKSFAKAIVGKSDPRTFTENAGEISKELVKAGTGGIINFVKKDLNRGPLERIKYNITIPFKVAKSATQLAGMIPGFASRQSLSAALSVVSPQEEIEIPTEFHKKIMGEEPIQSFQTRFKNSKKTLAQLGMSEEHSSLFSIVGVGLATWIDITGLTGSAKKKAQKEIENKIMGIVKDKNMLNVIKEEAERILKLPVETHNIEIKKVIGRMADDATDLGGGLSKRDIKIAEKELSELEIGKPRELKPIEQEALKFKSAKEFSESPDIFFHGSPRAGAENIEKIGFIKTVGGRNVGKGLSISEDFSVSKQFAESDRTLQKLLPKDKQGEVFALKLKPEAKILNADEFLNIRNNILDGLSRGDAIDLADKKGIIGEVDIVLEGNLKRELANELMEKELKKLKIDVIDFRGSLQIGKGLEGELVVRNIDVIENLGKIPGRNIENLFDKKSKSISELPFTAKISDQDLLNYAKSGEAVEILHRLADKKNLPFGDVRTKTFAKRLKEELNTALFEGRIKKEIIKGDDGLETVFKATDKFKEIEKQIINIDRIGGLTNKERDNLKTFVKANKDEILEAGGEKLPLKEIQRRAKQESDLMQGIIKRDDTAKQAAIELAMRNKEATLAKKAFDEGLEGEAKKQAFDEFFEVLKQNKAIGTDLARRLSARRIISEGEETTAQKIIKRIEKSGADIDDIKKKAADVDWDNAKEVKDFYRGFIKPTFGDIFDEFRYNNMLSNPRTQARNLFTNLTNTFIGRPLVKTLEATIDTFTAPLTGKERTALFKELPAYFGGVFRNVPKAIDDVKRVFREEIPIEKTDLAGRIPTGILPRFFRIPTLSLEAGDRFFQRLIRSGELASLEKRGITGAKAEKEAGKIAEYSLFRAGLDPMNKEGQGFLLSKMDKYIGIIDSLRNVKVGGVSPLGWFVPFLRTPMNFAKQWIEFSPLGLATLPGNVRKKEQIAKMMIGSTITAMGAQMAWDNKTTWRVPSDVEEKALFFASGKKPYSVLIGETWVPMMYLGPWAFALALPAAIKFHEEDSRTSMTNSRLEKLTNEVSALAEYYSQQTFMEGLGKFVDILSGDPDASATKSLAFSAGQVVPWQGMMRYITTVVDPVYRKSNGFVEEFEKSIPFLSKNLQPHTDPTGTIQRRNTSSYLAPFDLSREKPEFDQMLRVRQEELKSNAVINELKKENKEKASKVMIDINKAQTEEELVEIMKGLNENNEVKKAFKSLVKKQAEYIRGTVIPYTILTSLDRAEMVYSKFVKAENAEDSEDLQEFITALSENDMWGKEERKNLRRLFEKFPTE